MAKTLYSSYYAACKNTPNCVSISRSAPPGFPGRVVRTVAPNKELFDDYKAGRINWAEFTQRYVAQLQSTPNLDALFNDGEVLVCWEKDCKTCHRSLLASHLLYHYGIEVIEL